MDKIKEYLPVGSLFLLVIGALRLIFYYKFFKINIISYIDLSEIFSLSLSFFITGAAVSVVFLIFSVLTTYAGMLPKEMSGKHEYDSDEIPYSKRDGAIARMFSISFMVFYFSVTYDFMSLYKDDFRINVDTSIVVGMIVLTNFYIMYLVPSLKKMLLNYYDIKLPADFSSVVLAVLCLMTLCVVYTRNDARNVIMRKKAIYARVVLEDKTIESSDVYRYVGKTKNFIFFYNTKTEIPDAFSLDGVKSTSIDE